MGPTLEARLYTLEMLCITFDVSRQLAERGEACYALSPAHGCGGSQSRRTRRSLLTTPTPAPSPTRAGSQDEEKILLLPPLLLVPTLVREIIILFEIYVF